MAAVETAKSRIFNRIAVALVLLVVAAPVAHAQTTTPGSQIDVEI